MRFLGTIVEKNNWESVSYHSKSNDSIEFEAKRIKTLDCKWPNGEITTEKAKAVTQSVSYSDHGHTYSATSDHLYAQIDYNGKKILVPFNQLKVVGIEYTEPRGRRK